MISLRRGTIAAVLAWTVVLAATVGTDGRADQWEDLGLHRAQRGIGAPAFTLSDVDGRPVRLDDLRGRPVLLNFWASWCVPCGMEMPAIQRLQDRTHGIGLVVLAINFRESAGRVKEFAWKWGIGVRSLLDPQGAVSAKYQVRMLPFTVLIDRGGQVRAVAEGPRNWDSAALVTLVEQVAGEKY